MRLFLGLLTSILLLAACGGEPATVDAGIPTEVEKLTEEVMAVHDEVMPEMETIQALSEKLEDQKKGEKGDTEKITAALAKLEKADLAMMSWMRQYKMPSASSGQTKEQMMAYLQDQKTKIEAVSKEMKESIKFAQETLLAVNN